ncbi:hypothetical protein Z517_06983 [Fonsecaea pedrosoi CBS 271.37]|uniref:Unplaced genomic scaffold supercont1.4, whole genome shotgun sequence n=1 Tax=Fonsecaea pedrosoi CBS 271.37 TaxID=1442368 RepID=A0A0D2GHV0_9EURO|nr:uncharacterized protein Z517_06983 [Fonsecaea pedrosoi CBS 271.37]KIW80368.1 hypothetical protein Z517_06983 [Fonsecaea pedrosoi CBS 271.37]
MSDTKASGKNSNMIISRSSRDGSASFNATEVSEKFTGGAVWVDTVLAAEGILVHNVNFAPGARSFWHWHEKGQVLRVTAGCGWLCDRGAKPVRINVGDVIWCPSSTEHWHGADDQSYMVHQAVSLGSVRFMEEVSDDTYQAKTDSKA